MKAAFLGLGRRAGTGDPYWSSVVLLVANDNKANGTTSFADQSSSAKTITAVGNIQYSTTTPPTGMTSSCLADGGGDRLTTPSSADFNFGSGDFTVEGFIRFTSAPPLYGAYADQVISTSGLNRGWGVLFSNSTETTGQGLSFFYSTNGSNVNAVKRNVTWATATWYHIAACRSGNNLYLFVDGTQQGATADLTGVTLSSSTKNLKMMGCDETSGFDVPGYMASLRITKGVARYTANFTPPSLPLLNS